MPAGSDSAQGLDTPAIRQAGRELLSLAFMDARNHSLHLHAGLEHALETASPELAVAAGLAPPDWWLGELGWYQERWIARNLQRQLGPRCDPTASRLASLLPEADRWWDAVPLAQRWQFVLPPAEELRSYLLETLEATLDLLASAPETEAGLYLFHLALQHEDAQAERFIELAQALGQPLEPRLLQALTPPVLARQDPLWLPAVRWQQGSAPPGFAPDLETPAHAVDVPEFEIDTQPVCWAQFVEFVDDGGYDREALWSPAGWDWLARQNAAEGRRGPRHVEQIGVASGAVMQRRFGQPTRMAGLQPVMHVSWWEAEAWCRWAGRRLPLEVEWEIAAETASRRGFRWGDVWEWTASTLRPYPGFVPGPDAQPAQAAFGVAKVLRGASAATRARLKSPRQRRFEGPGQDAMFCGFRSCAI